MASGGHGQGAHADPDIGPLAASPAVPFPFKEAVMPPLDLQAEAANGQEPQGEVQLERLFVPLPLVAGESRRPRRSPGPGRCASPPV